MTRPRWIMTPTTEAFLLGLRDQVGNFVYKSEMEDKKTLWGIPYKLTQQLPTNLSAATSDGGTANDGAYIFLADFADVILAETYTMVVDASDVAAYKDAGGNLVSTFTRDQTAFRIEQTSIAARNNDPNEVTLRFVRWHAHGSTAYQQGEFAGFRRDVAQRLIAGGVAVLAEAAPILESRAVRGHERYADRAMVTK